MSKVFNLLSTTGLLYRLKTNLYAFGLQTRQAEIVAKWLRPRGNQRLEHYSATGIDQCHLMAPIPRASPEWYWNSRL